MIRITHDGKDHLVSDMIGEIDGMAYECHPNGTVDITTPTYQGFGSWIEVDDEEDGHA